MIQVTRTIVPRDSEKFAPFVRLEDQIEGIKSRNPSKFFQKLLMDSSSNSKYGHTIFDDGEPIAMFGIYNTGIVGVGVPWLVCSTKVLTWRNKKKLLPMGKRFLKKMLAEEYTLLRNCVDPTNHSAIRFIKHLGFTMTGESVKTEAGYDFLGFEMRRKDV
jgi:hypothetical protein